MEYEDSDRPRPHLNLLIALPAAAATALLLLSIALVAWGPPNDLTSVAFLLGIPAAIGALVTLASSRHRSFNTSGCLGLPLALAVIAGAGTIWLEESLVCVAMLTGIWFVAGLGGGAVALWFRWRQRAERGRDAIYVAAWPLLLGITLLQPAPQDDWRIVSRSVDLDASPEVVWPQVVSIENVGPDEGRWNFSQDVIGIPRPTAARLTRHGDGYVRRAQWGRDIRFEERVVRIVPGREIVWEFHFPDRSISLHTDRHIHPYSEKLSIETGGYRLLPLKSGKTRLTLWTKYRQRVGLPSYTAWWGERFLGDIQTNVLAIIDGRVSARS